MKCQCGAVAFRGHMLMVRRGAVPPHTFYVRYMIKKEVKK